jgi:hypothetical protein
MPHRIACVTNAPTGIDQAIDIIAPPGDFESVTIPTWPAGKPQCLRRISMFRPDAADIFGERFICMDLDCVISAPLDPLFDVPDDFKIYRGTANDRPYNGSMLLLTAGARREVFDRFTPERAVAAGFKFTGSDQAWISYTLGRGQPTWGRDDGVLWFGELNGAPDALRRVTFFPGLPKPWEALWDNEFVAENYRRSGRPGRCLVLGHGDHVWTDLAGVIDSGPFEAVIASPEAAAHWPAKLLAIASHDLDADRLVKMHGFAEAIYCGRPER